MRPYQFTTGTATPALTKIQDAVAFLGYCATNAEAATIFLKLWWAHNSGTELPVIGTTVPDVVIPIPSAGQPPIEFTHPLQGGGPLWVAVTKNAIYSDDTALTTGGDIITLFLD